MSAVVPPSDESTNTVSEVNEYVIVIDPQPDNQAITAVDAPIAIGNCIYIVSYSVSYNISYCLIVEREISLICDITERNQRLNVFF